MAAPVLQFKRGLLANLPGLRAGEPGFTTDSYDLYVGIDSSTNNNKFFGSHRYWSKETTSKGSGINLVEGTATGTSYITIKAPDSLVGVTTYTFPGVDGSNGYILTTDGNGVLSFSAPAASSFTIAADSGTPDSVSTGSTLTFVGGTNVNTAVTDNTITVNLDNNVDLSGGLKVAGITTLTGRVEIDDNVYVTGVTTISNGIGTVHMGIGATALLVEGDARITGILTIGQGSITIDGNTNFVGLGTAAPTGDQNSLSLFSRVTDPPGYGSFRASGPLAKIIWQGLDVGLLSGTHASGVYGLQSSESDSLVSVGIITATQTSSLAAATASSLNVSGITTLAGGVTLGDNTSDNITVGGEFVSSLNPNATDSYDLGTSTQRWRNLWLSGNLNVAGIISATTYQDIFVADKDLILANTTNPTDTTANHGGVAVASTEGSPLVEFGISGINTLPTTYKQMMWVKGGTMGAGTTDAWLFNYAVGVGSTQVPDGVVFAAGSVQVSSSGTVTASSFKGSAGVAITQFSSSVSTGTSTSSVPTSSAIIDYVDSEIGAIDLTTSIAGDSGTGSVSTSQTLTIAGTAGEIETSATSQTITIGLPNDVIVGTSLSSPTVKVATIQHSNATQAATIDSSGNITASQNLTINGNLYVNGSTTQVNTSEMTVYDRTITLGIQTGTTPTTTSWDLGVLMNYGDAGVAKTAGVIWEYGNERFVFSANSDNPASSGTTTPNITVATYAPIEIGALWVNDCAGQSQVISCTGSERFLENITVDAGSF